MQEVALLAALQIQIMQPQKANEGKLPVAHLLNLAVARVLKHLISRLSATDAHIAALMNQY